MTDLPKRRLNILVCPLDWGLGHASRMIPLIHEFKKDGHAIIMAATGRSGTLLQESFPDLPYLNFPSPMIRIGEGLNSNLGLLLQIPRLVFSVFREHVHIRRLVRLHRIDIVISDNRYGLYCREAYTVFVTHQVSPVLPGLLRWFEYPLYRIIRHIIGYYNECWIPDNEDPEYNLSGELSHRFKIPGNAKFIGILSRFSHMEIKRDLIDQQPCNLVAILSGPEPQISRFELLLCRQLQNRTEAVMFIRGMRGDIEKPYPVNNPNLKWFSHMPLHSFARIVTGADYVICRSGYTGIMDLVALNIQAILVPTPGQSEQEYLASYLRKKGWFRVISQKDLNLPAILETNRKTTGPDLRPFFISGEPSCCRNLYSKYCSYDKKSYNKS